jgi:prepilin-type N-terminal cleavage/methylation domain-containing protein
MRCLTGEDGAGQFRRGRPRAFTLVEVVVSTAILAIVMLACVSVLVVAQRALILNDPGSAPVQAASAREAVDLVTADLRVATSVVQAGPTTAALTVPDRTGDGTPETLVYAWSGTPGDPLTRSYNGGPAAAILENVQALTLSSLLRQAGPPAQSESAEQVLFYHDDAVGGSMKDYNLESTKWCATYFKPALPANAVAWKITRVSIVAKQEGGTVEGFAIVGLRQADAALKPTWSAIDGAAVSEWSLSSSYAWTEVSFTTASGLDPTKGYCLVIRQAATSGNAARIQWEDSVTETDNRWTTTSDSGSSWATPDTTKHLRFYVYGTVTTQ